MTTEWSWTVRAEQLAAVLATKRGAVVARLCALPAFVSLLTTWLTSAELDSQTTFLRQLLHALGQLPVQGPSLAQSGLLRTVAHLQKYRQVAASCWIRRWPGEPVRLVRRCRIAPSTLLVYLPVGDHIVVSIIYVLVSSVHPWGCPSWLHMPEIDIRFLRRS
jgi:hypothetical protein